MESIRIGELERIRSSVQSGYSRSSKVLYISAGLFAISGMGLYFRLEGSLGLLMAVSGGLAAFAALAFGLSVAEDSKDAVADLDSSLEYPFIGWVMPREEWREFATDHNLQAAENALEWMVKGLAASCILYCLGLVFTGEGGRLELLRFCSLGFLSGLTFAVGEGLNMNPASSGPIRCIITPGGVVIGHRYIPICQDGEAFTGLGIICTGGYYTIKVEYRTIIPLIRGFRNVSIPMPGDSTVDHNRLTDYLWGLWTSGSGTSGSYPAVQHQA